MRRGWNPWGCSSNTKCSSKLARTREHAISLPSSASLHMARPRQSSAVKGSSRSSCSNNTKSACHIPTEMLVCSPSTTRRCSYCHIYKFKPQLYVVLSHTPLPRLSYLKIQLMVMTTFYPPPRLCKDVGDAFHQGALLQIGPCRGSHK